MKTAQTIELIGKLYDMNQIAMECVYLLQNAFVFDSSKSLDECQTKANEIHGPEKALTERLIEDMKSDPGLKVYVPVPGHIERMGDYIEDIIGCIRVKIADGILFSNKAVSETTFLMERLQDVLKNTSDIILSRNIILRDYVKESAIEINRSANEFATMHEDRLIEGLCMPKASPLFLHMMDAIKGIAWHARETAEKLTVT